MSIDAGELNPILSKLSNAHIWLFSVSVPYLKHMSPLILGALPVCVCVYAYTFKYSKMGTADRN